MEKTDQTQSAPALPEVCCGRCAHGTEVRIANGLQSLVQCRALPPVPVLRLDLPAGPDGGAMIHSMWPVNPPVVWCGMFMPRQMPSAPQTT